MQYLAFVLQSPRCKLVCIHIPEVICFMLVICFAQTCKAVVLGAFTTQLFYVWHCWVKLPTAGWLLQGSHISWILPCLHVPLSHMRSSRVHLCVKMVGSGKNSVTISAALYITCMENESRSAEHALSANGILHPIYLLLPSFKTT